MKYFFFRQGECIKITKKSIWILLNKKFNKVQAEFVDLRGLKDFLGWLFSENKTEKKLFAGEKVCFEKAFFS